MMMITLNCFLLITLWYNNVQLRNAFMDIDMRFNPGLMQMSLYHIRDNGVTIVAHLNFKYNSVFLSVCSIVELRICV